MVTLLEVLAEAIRRHKAGQVERAAPLYRSILAVHPGHPDALHFLALTHRQCGAPEHAARLMGRALAVNATLASRHADLGSALLELGRPEAAADACRAAIRRQPDFVQARRSLGEALCRQERSGTALPVLRQALALQPDWADLLYETAVCAQADTGVLAARANEEAAVLLRRTVILQPDHVLGWINLGIVLYLLGRVHRAAIAYRHALAIEPGAHRTLFRFGQMALTEGKSEEADTLLRRANTLVPDDREAVPLLDRVQRYRRLSAMAGDTSLPPGLAVRGSFRNTSGYAFMVRQFVRQLSARAVPVHFMDMEVPFLSSTDGAHHEAELEALGRPVRPRAMLNLMIPTLAEEVPGLDTIVFSMSEVRRVPPEWITHGLRHRHLIVPTPSSAEAWIGTGYPAERVHLCPLGVDPRPLSSGIEPMAVRDPRGLRFADYRTRIANISDLTSRKNLDGLLRVWLRATRRNDDAALLLKLGKGIPDEDERISAFLRSVAEAVGIPFPQAAPVFVLSGNFSDTEMTALLAGSTHYWSMSHGEGWDLPMTQAGAMGLGLIAPRHSAYTAYLDDGVATMLPSRPTPARPPYAGLEWWTPDEDAAAAAITGVIRGGIPARSARERLIAEFSWEKAGLRLIEVLRGIGAL